MLVKDVKDVWAFENATTLCLRISEDHLVQGLACSCIHGDQRAPELAVKLLIELVQLKAEADPCNGCMGTNPVLVRVAPDSMQRPLRRLLKSIR